MPTVKVSELRGKALDWSVALALGTKPVYNWEGFGATFNGPWESNPLRQEDNMHRLKMYSKYWEHGGPIIEKMEMEFLQMRNPDYIKARTLLGDWVSGTTMLEAAMRAYVATTLGTGIEIPEELCPNSKS